MDLRIELDDNNDDCVHIIIALMIKAICDHEAVLSDPRTNLATCLHRRMLTDDVLSCDGILHWWRGNAWLLCNKHYTVPVSLSKTAGDIFRCIYDRGNWQHACGSEANFVMQDLTKKFTVLARKHYTVFISSMNTYNMCNICKRSQMRSVKKMKVYYGLEDARFTLLRDLIYNEQNLALFSECDVLDYPLNSCHLRNIWRRDVYSMFCHNISIAFEPVARPHLPLCHFDQWLDSSNRICNMGYNKLMRTAFRIPRCTDNKDELFKCYKGINMNCLSWGIISAGRSWRTIFENDNLGDVHHSIYQQVKLCSHKVYDKLRRTRTCKPGPEVVQLIQDLRTVLMIDLASIFSNGKTWLYSYDQTKKYFQDNQC